MTNRPDSSAQVVSVRAKFDNAAATLTWRLKIFFRRRCKTTDEADRVEDWVQETLFRVMEKIESGVEIDNVEAYVVGTAHFVFQEFLNRIVSERDRKQQLNWNALPQMAAAAQAQDVETQSACLNRCLSELNDEDRALVDAWYAEPAGAAKIDRHRLMAEELMVPDSTLRVRIFRLLKRLRSCCKKCMEEETKRNSIH